MPVYEYRCRYCGYEVSKRQKINDPPLQHCLVCDKPSLKKVISKTSFKLTGSGWYETDFKPNPKEKEATKTKDSKNHHDTAKAKDNNKTSDNRNSSKSKTDMPATHHKQKSS